MARAAAAAALALTTAGCASMATGPSGADWTLDWADEFNGATLDPSRWSAATDCWGGGNRERQCYTDRPENLAVRDGALRIRARAEAASGPSRPNRTDQTSRREYTSARIDTRGKAAWRGGRVEVRAKLPQGAGLWPAIWMLPEAHVPGVSPLMGEIDIAEAVNLGARCPECRDGRERRVWTALHYPTPVAPAERRRSIRLEDLSAFHTYSLEWTDQAMIWRLDGRPFHRVRTWTRRDASGEPFDQPYYLILNLAVGGSWPERGGRAVDKGAMPAEMVVDWVRVYRQAPPNER